MAPQVPAELEQALNRSLMVYRTIERAVHDSDAMWQIRPEGGPSLYADVSIDQNSVTFDSIGRLPREVSMTYVDILLNGEIILTRPLSRHLTLSPEDSLSVTLSLSTFALA